MKHLSLALTLSLCASSTAFSDFDYTWSQNVHIPNMRIVSLDADNGIVVKQTNNNSFTVSNNPDNPYWAGNISVTLQQNDKTNCELSLEAAVDLSIQTSTCDGIKPGDMLETKDLYGFKLSNDYLSDGYIW